MVGVGVLAVVSIFVCDCLIIFSKEEAELSGRNKKVTRISITLKSEGRKLFYHIYFQGGYIFAPAADRVAVRLQKEYAHPCVPKCVTWVSSVSVALSNISKYIVDLSAEIINYIDNFRHSTGFSNCFLNQFIQCRAMIFNSGTNQRLFSNYRHGAIHSVIICKCAFISPCYV